MTATIAAAVITLTCADYQPMFERVSDIYNGWPSAQLLAAIARVESNCNPTITGGAGEYGMMQIMPATWNEHAPQAREYLTHTIRARDGDDAPGAADLDPYNDFDNVLVAAKYLIWLRNVLTSRFKIEPKTGQILASYNWGIGHVIRTIDTHADDWYGNIPEMVQNYVSKVIFHGDM